MLTMNDANVNFNGISKDAEAEEVFATMSASSSGSTTYFSLTVEKDSEQVDADFKEFKTKVLAAVASMKK